MKLLSQLKRGRLREVALTLLMVGSLYSLWFLSFENPDFDENPINLNASSVRAYPVKLPEIDPNFTCAPWIPERQRRIYTTWHGAYGWQTTWKTYQKGHNQLGGEWYWLASLEYVLHKLGFQLVKSTDYAAITALKEGRAHRYIRFNQIDGAKLTKPARKRFGPSVANDTGLTCRLRYFAWWNDAEPDPTHFWFDDNHPLDPFQVLNPLDDNAYYERNTTYRLPGPLHDRSMWPQLHKEIATVPNSTGMPFVVHSSVLLPPVSEKEAARGRRGFIQSKTGRLPLNSVIMLLEAGFELHTSCPRDPNHPDRQLLDEKIPHELRSSLVHHGMVPPLEFSKILRTMAFVAGFGSIDAPTPLEGLAQGAAFLNPFNPRTNYTQHRTLVHLGPPHVYNFEVVGDEHTNQTARNVLEAAELAVRHRFASFVPEPHRLENVLLKVCRYLIESDNICHDGVARQRQSASYSARGNPLLSKVSDGILHFVGTTFLHYIVSPVVEVSPWAGGRNSPTKRWIESFRARFRHTP